MDIAVNLNATLGKRGTPQKWDWVGDKADKGSGGAELPYLHGQFLFKCVLI